jgi:hypothetical protein
VGDEEEDDVFRCRHVEVECVAILSMRRTNVVWLGDYRYVFSARTVLYRIFKPQNILRVASAGIPFVYTRDSSFTNHSSAFVRACVRARRASLNFLHCKNSEECLIRPESDNVSIIKNETCAHGSPAAGVWASYGAALSATKHFKEKTSHAEHG